MYVVIHCTLKYFRIPPCFRTGVVFGGRGTTWTGCSSTVRSASGTPFSGCSPCRAGASAWRRTVEPCGRSCSPSACVSRLSHVVSSLGYLQGQLGLDVTSETRERPPRLSTTTGATLWRFLRQTPSLLALSLADLRFVDDIILEGIATLCPFLERLDLRNCAGCGRNRNCSISAYGIEQGICRLRHLTELNIERCCIQGLDYTLLARMLVTALPLLTTSTWVQLLSYRRKGEALCCVVTPISVQTRSLSFTSSQANSPTASPEFLCPVTHTSILSIFDGSSTLRPRASPILTFPFCSCLFARLTWFSQLLALAGGS